MTLSRIAIKQLTPSDLSFFAQHLKKSKQKAINLNSDVFVDLFYPGLKGRNDEFSIKPLRIIGPGGKPTYALTRKAVRSSGGKNWRLDGEIVHDPPEEPGRFNELREDDFAVLAFEGASQPEVATLILVSAAEDAPLHEAIRSRLSFPGKQSMVNVSEAELSEILEATRDSYGEQHPLETLLLPDTIEETVFGSATSQERAAKTDGRGVLMSQVAFRLQLRAAEETGQQGEEVFDQWLEATGHDDEDYEWVSRSHPRAAYDFHVGNPKWPSATGEIFVDVKATKGAFESPVHMSMAELRWAATHANYRIARVYALGTDTPRLTMLTKVHELAKLIAEAADTALPSVVKIDSVELAIASFQVEFEEDVEPAGE